MAKYFKVMIVQHNYRGETTKKRIPFPVQAETWEEAADKLSRVVARTNWSICNEEIRPCSKDEAATLLRDIMNIF